MAENHCPSGQVWVHHGPVDPVSRRSDAAECPFSPMKHQSSSSPQWICDLLVHQLAGPVPAMVSEERLGRSLGELQNVSYDVVIGAEENDAQKTFWRCVVAGNDEENVGGKAEGN